MESPFAKLALVAKAPALSPSSPPTPAQYQQAKQCKAFAEQAIEQENLTFANNAKKVAELELKYKALEDEANRILQELASLKDQNSRSSSRINDARSAIHQYEHLIQYVEHGLRAWGPLMEAAGALQGGNNEF